MLKHKRFHLLFLLAILVFSSIAGNLSTNNSGNDTVVAGLSQDESILFNMINDMRRQNKLSSIPLSLDLCKVAQTHIADLIKWKPQEKGCSLHSWSGSGKWTSCCNTKEVFGIQCMKSKPREITGYPGDGYELIYWGEDNATPAEAAALWKQVGASSDMILSQAKWSEYQWKAIGVGIKSGYAILWLGDAVNANISISSVETQAVAQKATPESKNTSETPESEKKITKPETAAISMEPEKKSTKPEPREKQKAVVSSQEIKEKPVSVITSHFYVIIGSFKENEAANSELKKVRLKGHPAAFILYQEPLYRIALASFEQSEKAYKMKNELKEIFPGIWIFKK